MALTNYAISTEDADVAATPVEYINMCIGSGRTCSGLTRNFCVTSVFAAEYAGSTTTGGVCLMKNNNCPSVFTMNMVIPKGNCLAGTCSATFHGYFFGD